MELEEGRAMWHRISKKVLRKKGAVVVPKIRGDSDAQSMVKVKFWYPFTYETMSRLLRTTQHQLVKLSYSNRRVCLRIALSFGVLSTCCLAIATFTNNWLYTIERLPYYVPSIKNWTTTTTTTTTPAPPTNISTTTPLPSFTTPGFSKNATLGPWIYCSFEPEKTMQCSRINFLSTDEPSDTTTSVEMAVRKTTFFLVASFMLVLLGLALTVVCNMREHAYRLNLAAGVIQIFAGMSTFLCLIIYMASVSKEVGKKLYPASALDEPLFYYNFGFSFVSVMASFLCTQMSALFIISVYMAKHDEMMYNKYHIRSLFKSSGINVDAPLVEAGLNLPTLPNRSSGYKRTGSLRRFSNRLSSPSITSVQDQQQCGERGSIVMTPLVPERKDLCFVSSPQWQGHLPMSPKRRNLISLNAYEPAEDEEEEEETIWRRNHKTQQMKPPPPAYDPNPISIGKIV